MRKGFSIIELMLSGALFAVFAWGVVETLLLGFATDRLAEETTIATGYASEAIEAVRSIQAKNFDDLIVTDATGLARNGNDWEFSGEEDTFGKYTRVIGVAETNRDGDGNIAESGDADPDTRLVTVTVTWNVVPSRENSIVLNTYLTRWR